MILLTFIFGLVFLIIGAEALVRGASRLASSLGIAPLIIGLTVVAFGTSSPELAVSLKASLANQADIALGNIIGSNIFNVLFILGLSALIVPLVVSRQLVRLDVPLMIGLSILVLLLSLDRNFGRVDGLLMLASLCGYLVFLIRQSRREVAPASDEFEQEYGGGRSASPQWLRNGVLIIVGLGLLLLGSRWLVDSAVTFARHLGVSELIVGLTIVAAGTSLPEVVTSLFAALKGERDIAVGNVVGSNLFNIMGVLGIAGLVAPGGVPISSAVLGFDLPVMIAVALACLPMFFTGGIISRWEGAVLLAYYATYTTYLILAAAQHDLLPVFNHVVLYFALPITAMSLLLIASREALQRRSQRRKRVPPSMP